MCYFLSLVIPKRVDDIESYFDKSFQIVDFSDSLLGRIYRKVNTDAVVYHVLSSGCSCDLLKKELCREIVQLFKAGFSDLMSTVSVTSVLNHWYHNQYEDEKIIIRKEVKVLLEEFLEIFPDIEEDVKYLIKNPAFWHRKSPKGAKPLRL